MRSPTKLPSPLASAKRWAKDRGGQSSKRRSLPRGWHNWALGALCLLVVVLAITSVGSSSADSAAAQRTATVQRGVVQSTVSGNGSLEAAQQVELDFGASGEVTEIDVQAGQRVSKGDVLARIDSSSARASLASAEAQLAEAEETLEAAEEGGEVSAVYERGATTVLASYESDSAAVSATEGGEGAAEGEPTEGGGAEKGDSGTKKPSKPDEGTSEPSEGSGGKGKPEQAETEQGAAKPEEAPSSTTTEPSVEAAPSEAPSSSPSGGGTVSVATAEAKLRQARLSVKSARQEVRETALRAPISGTVASVSGSVGETVSGEGSGATGGSGGESSSGGGIGGLGVVGASSSGSSSGSGSSSAFIVLSQLGRLKMEVSFSESDIGKVKVGQPATVAVSSMEGTELAGRVTEVGVLPSEGSSSGVVEYPATITLTQSAKGVRAGMSASAEVVVEQVTGALSLTSEAISSGPGGGSVTVREGGKEVQRSVTTGLKGDETTQLLSGLKAGETVVLPEITAAAGSQGPSGEGGGFPGGGSLPSFRGGGPPGGFPGAP